MKAFVMASGALALSLAGCAELIEAQRRADNAQCVEEGFRPGTDNFRLCRLTVEQIRDRRAAERRAEDQRRSDEEAQRRRRDDEEAQARRRQQDEDDRRRREEDQRRREEDSRRMSCFSTPKPFGCP